MAEKEKEMKQIQEEKAKLAKKKAEKGKRVRSFVHIYSLVAYRLVVFPKFFNIVLLHTSRYRKRWK